MVIYHFTRRIIRTYIIMKSKSKKYGGIGQILPSGVLEELYHSIDPILIPYTLLNGSHKRKIKNVIVTYYEIYEIIRIYENRPDDDMENQILNQITYIHTKSAIENLQYMVNAMRILINDFHGQYKSLYDTTIIDQLNHIIDEHKTKSRKYVKSGSHSKNAKKSKSSTRRRHSAPI